LRSGIGALRKDLANEAHRLALLELVAGREGNISARFGNAMLVKATGQFLSDAKAADFIRVDLAGKESFWRRRPSIEVNMHRLIYLKRKDVNAVVHTHPPYVTAFCVAGKPIDPVTTEAQFYFPQGIPIIGRETPGTLRLAEAVSDRMKDGLKALLLSQHGLVTVGKDLREAVELNIAAERTAQSAALSRLLGIQSG